MALKTKTSSVTIRIIVLTCALCFSVASNANPNHVEATKTITIAGDEWCPINCSQDATNPGYMIEVAQEAFGLTGYHVEYIEMPWMRAVNLARNGEIDAIVGAFEDDAPDFVFPTEPILFIRPSTLFARQGLAWQFTGIDSLREVTLGVIGGYDYGARLNAFIDTSIAASDSRVIQIYGDNATSRNIELLRKQRADLIVETDVVFWHIVRSSGDESRFKEVAQLTEPEGCHIAFSPTSERSKQLAIQLDSGIKQLKKNNRLTELAGKYQISLKYMSPPSSD